MSEVTAVTGAGIDYIRICTVIRAIETHIKFNGRFRLTRMATPANLRAIASEYTGKTYRRSAQGLENALHDLKVVKENWIS